MSEAKYPVVREYNSLITEGVTLRPSEMDEESRFSDEIHRLRYAQTQNDRLFDERERRREDFDLRKELLNKNVSAAVADSIATAWVRHYGSGLAPSIDYAYAMVRDPNDGSIYVTGQSGSTFTGDDYLTIKYNSAGELVWAARYNGPGNNYDIALAIALDAYGNVYVTGYSEGSDWSVYTTVKYTQDAMTTLSININDRWNIISVPLTLNDYRRSTLFPTAITPAYTYTNFYVIKDTLKNGVGYWLKFPFAQTVPMTGFQITFDTIDVVEGWNMIGSISYPIPVSDITSIPGGIITSYFYGYDRGYKITDSIYPGSGYWVKVNQAGKLILSSSGLILIANKIRIVPTKELPPPPPAEVTKVEELLLPTEFALEQNYPNPFNPVTVIRYQLPVDSWVTLKIYDIIGKEVKALVNEFQAAGFKSVSFDGSNLPSGVYVYRLTAGSFSDVKKLLLLK